MLSFEVGLQVFSQLRMTLSFKIKHIETYRKMSVSEAILSCRKEAEPGVGESGASSGVAACGQWCDTGQTVSVSEPPSLHV